MSFSISGKTAIVTGAANGVGLAIARHFADVGANVMLADMDEERLSEETGAAGGEGNMQSFVGDLRERLTQANLLSATIDAFDRVDILVNCAGITRDGTFKRMTLDQWRAVLSTNLDSVFNVTKNVVDGMAERKFGRIINISSLNGEKGQFGQSNYSAAKGGMHGFTMALAQETARNGITVNTVSPGYLSTKMVMAVPEEVLQKIIAQIPVGRLGKAEEIADMVAFLARDEAGYITGTNISINGGQHMRH